MNATLALLSLLLVLVAGCSQRTASGPTQPAGPASPAVLSVTPADGATSVRLDGGVTLDFGAAVDRSSVESGFHLVSEFDMTGSCPDPSMGSHGSMDEVMADPNMMAHMSEAHETPGSFSWNAAGTACTFMPESQMRSQTRYMMHMSGAMLERMRETGVGMMDGRMTAAGEMMLHFQTVTTDDHEGHH